jgi:hypothetical protein
MEGLRLVKDSASEFCLSACILGQGSGTMLGLSDIGLSSVPIFASQIPSLASLLPSAEERPSTNLRPHRLTGDNRDSRETENMSVVEDFDYWRGKPDLAVAVAAIKALTAVIKRSKATTMMGLEIELKKASEELKVGVSYENCLLSTVVYFWFDYGKKDERDLFPFSKFRLRQLGSCYVMLTIAVES